MQELRRATVDKYTKEAGTAHIDFRIPTFEKASTLYELERLRDIQKLRNQTVSALSKLKNSTRRDTKNNLEFRIRLLTILTGIAKL